MEVAVPAIFGTVRGGGVSFWWCLGTRVLGRGSPQHRQKGPVSLTCVGTERPFESLEALGIVPVLNPQAKQTRPGAAHFRRYQTSQSPSPLSCFLYSWGLAQLVTGARPQRPPDPELRGLLDLAAPLLSTASSTATSLRDPCHCCGA